MSYKARILESEGVYISIMFSRNLDRIPSWRYVIESIEDLLYESAYYTDYKACELDALKKAVEYL